MQNSYIEDGYILLPRNILDEEIWNNKPNAYLKIYLYIYLKVNHKSNGYSKRGSNFFNFSKVDIPDVSYNQISDFLRWAKKERILTTEKTTRGVIVTINDYDIKQNPDNYKFQNEKQNKNIIEAKSTQNENQTINNNEIIKECKKDSLSEQITQEERETLINFFKKQNISNPQAYLRKVIDNGDYKVILEEAKRNIAKKSQSQNHSNLTKILEDRKAIDNMPEEDKERIKILQQQIRNNLKQSIGGNKNE